tara:strand:+ start:1576 stop:2151 length:576 start_codon:yes stop_codon:yes gene_type:complete
VSNILITPIKIDGTHYCLQTSGLTVPILGGSPSGQSASTTPKVGPESGSGLPTLTGDNVFNVYQALGTTGSGPANQFRDSPAITGSIKFGVHPCAEKIDIQVAGRADTYGTGFDTLDITIDGVSIKDFESNADDAPGSAPFSNTVKYDETVTHTFSTDIPCGHIVNISGASGTFANNNVGYDVKITVTLPT